ncbi:type VI secretion system tip protein VgrG [Mucilaginibacter sp. cycad4]|uniref:type VI secretion system tip protein VgrG n=1 Tax=Mucilaginibacter sp. cycad4 TaxID=3342096 RepID=UPI002AAAB1A1|nr:type VI secretion system tip protein VgrG [Mucilaginibacter gossypii]WPV01748.1 type VI secretion system tip protein VgrG [Mucilaginibacter gossypii]
MSSATFSVKSEGEIMPVYYQLVNIDIVNDVNRIAYAELTLLDGDFAKQAFIISDTSFFNPGKPIEIKLWYADQPAGEKVVFEGIVIKHSLKKSGSSGVLSVEISDRAVKMTSKRKSYVFNDITDQDVISKLIKDCGLSVGSVDATSTSHRQIVQYNTTNWDMMLSRAEVNGLLVKTTNGVISAQRPDLDAAAKYAVEIGKDEVFDFELQMDSRNQYASIKSRTWDASANQMTETSNASDVVLKQGNLSASIVASAMGGIDNDLIATIPASPGEAKAWADAWMVKTRLSMLKGSFRIDGSTAVKIGDIFELKGAGAKFSGENLVTGVRHRFNPQGWFTTIQFGLSADWFSSVVHTSDSKAAGLLPGVNGLQIGIVQAFEADPEEQFRVKVEIPAVDGERKTVWARLAALDGGVNHGSVFWPDANDEVLLGFINDDPRHPVILGSLYGKKNTPPISPVEKNPEKGFATRSGMKVLFDDEKKTLSILTSENNKVLIDEENKFIELKDITGNIVKLSDNGITLQSDKNITVSAAGNIAIEGKNVKIKGSAIDMI